MNSIHIQLTFTSADDRRPDPARVGAVARAAVAELRAAGYVVEPTYTGARGDVPFDILMQLVQRLHDSQPFLTEVVKLITPIVAALLAARGQPAAHQPPPQITVVVQLGHARVRVPTDKVQDDQWLLEQLLLADPTLTTTVAPDSRVAVGVEIAAPAR